MLKYNIEVKAWSGRNLTKCAAAAGATKHICNNDTSRKDLVIFNDGTKTDVSDAELPPVL